jgi:hypothetical protein
VESVVSCDIQGDFYLCGPSELMKTLPALPRNVPCKWPQAIRCDYSSCGTTCPTRHSHTILRRISRTFRSFTVLSASVIILHSAKGSFSKCYLTTVSSATIIQHLWRMSVERRCYDTASGNDTQRKKEEPGENSVPVPLHSPQIPQGRSVF